MSGKLLTFVMAIAFAGLATMFRPVSAIAADLPVDLELVLAVDVSGSVDVEEGELQRNGYVSALAHPRVIETIGAGFHGRIAVTYLEWSDAHSSHVIVPWKLVSDVDSAQRLASALASAERMHGLYTSITGVIEFAIPLFDGNGFEGRRRVIDISGDGPNNVGGLVTSARDIAIAAGITINGLPIVNDRPNPRGRLPMPNLDLYYRDCVIGGPWSFMVVAEDFRSFADAVRRKLLIEIGGWDPGALDQRYAGMNGSGDVAYAQAVSGSNNLLPSRNPIPVLRHAVAVQRIAPPCDEGERLLRLRQQREFDEF